MEDNLECSENRIAVIGLGYVGLPLAVTFSKKYRVTGYEIDKLRVAELKKGYDRTKELTPIEIAESDQLKFTDDITDIHRANIFIVTVPTPLADDGNPDLHFLLEASGMIGRILKKGDLVIYESTVYPGCTEEDCVPVLEENSGLKYNVDFFCGYSPERINPGDRSRKITDIKKVTSGSTDEVAKNVDALYASIIKAGTYLAPSIKVAEASKAIENAQRDVNISFMNELALMFDKMGIDTNSVLEAAATKWNFLPFRPGLVGGHCIGVDPHYLAFKAIAAGYEPQVILSGRKVNEQMGIFIGRKVINLLWSKKKMAALGARVLILGITFKENCTDTRNTKVIDIYKTLIDEGAIVSVFDPWASSQGVKEAFGIELVQQIDYQQDAVILAVAHDIFKQIVFTSFKKSDTVIFDAKGMLELDMIDGRL